MSTAAIIALSFALVLATGAIVYGLKILNGVKDDLRKSIESEVAARRAQVGAELNQFTTERQRDQALADLAAQRDLNSKLERDLNNAEKLRNEAFKQGIEQATESIRQAPTADAALVQLKLLLVGLSQMRDVHSSKADHTASTDHSGTGTTEVQPPTGSTITERK